MGATDKIKVLHTIRQGKIGGGETHVLQLIERLDPDIFESEVLSFTEGEMVNELHSRGVKCTVVPTTQPFDFQVWPAVEEILSEGNFDLLHAHGTRAASNSFRPAQRCNVPLIYTIHGWSFHPDQSYVKRKFCELSEEFLTNRSTLNIAVSDSNQEQGLDKWKMPHSVVIKNGIDLHRFDPRGDYKDCFSIPPQKIRVGIVARLTDQKDPETFIRAAAKTLSANPNFHFVIVGGGPLEESCQSLATELGIEGQVTFAGFKTNVAEVLHSLDIYCLPSLWEGLPIGVLEAMAMEKVVVATPVDGTAEIITNGRNGFLFPEKDEEKLASILLKLATDKDRCREVGKNARKHVSKHYSIDDTVQKVAGQYRRVLNRSLLRTP